MIAPPELDIRVPAGRIHAEVHGDAEAPLTIAIPGLSASLRSFDFLIERLAGSRRRVLAMDPRGRGQSDAGAAGTHGWPAHAADVLAVADAVGAPTFSVMGWSMGAAVAMEIARIAPDRLTRAVLIDACGELDPLTIPVIRAVAERIGTVFPSAEIFIDLARKIGTVVPWSDAWDRYFRSDLVPTEGGVRTRSDRSAVMEDLVYGETHAWRPLWPHLTMPVLLVRATLPLLPSLGHIVPAAERDAFLAQVPRAGLVEVDANHYGIGTHPATAEAIAAFL